MVDDTVGTRDKAVYAIKGAVSWLPKLGLKRKPRFHPDGITFVVAVKDEEKWIAPCIRSIQDAADEIIIVDSSVLDNTTKIVDDLAAANKKIKHIRFYCDTPSAFALSLHIGLATPATSGCFKWGQ